jgi:hypothetical protein
MSEHCTYWHLHKSIYGLKCEPHHWYLKFANNLHSAEFSLHLCKNDPCILYGTPLPGKPTLYLVIYVNDFSILALTMKLKHIFSLLFPKKLILILWVMLNGI